MAKVARTSEEILPEDKVTNALIDKWSGESHVEVPYHNYGERGYVDLLFLPTDHCGWAIEIKSNPRSANKVLRQFNKMRHNFLEGSDYTKITRLEFKLIFTASHKTYNHVINNLEMYNSLENNQIMFADEEGNIEMLTDKPKSSEFKQKLSDNLKGMNLGKDSLACPYCGKEYKVEGYYRKHVEQCNNDLQVSKVEEVHG